MYNVAMERIGEPREIATVVRFLASEDFDLHDRQRRRRRWRLDVMNNNEA